MPTALRKTALPPPGRRELGERWSASGVQLVLGGRSRVPQAARQWLARSVAASALVLMALGAAASMPTPAAPMILGCVGEARWSDACRAVGPQPIAASMPPQELARRLSAAWDFDPNNDLWRAGGIPYHLARRARAARAGDEAPARAAVGLAAVLPTPASYGAWETADADPADRALAAELAAVYEAEVESLWSAHLVATRAAHVRHTAVQAAWQGFLGGLLPGLLALWALLAAALVSLRLARWRAERPLHLTLGPHTLELDGVGLPIAALAAVDVRWGRLELALHDGSRWTSRPLAPRNPGRLEVLLASGLRPSGDYGAEQVARVEVHRALSGVLSQVTAS